MIFSNKILSSCMRTLLLGAVAAIVNLPCRSYGDDSLVAQYDFEGDQSIIKDWVGCIKGGNQPLTRWTKPFTGRLDTTTSHSGANSLRIDVEAGDKLSIESATTPWIPINALQDENSIVQVQFYAKARGVVPGQLAVRILAFGPDQKPLGWLGNDEATDTRDGAPLLTFPATEKWGEFQCAGRLPQQTRWVSVFFSVKGNQIPVTLWLDDISVIVGLR